MNTHAELLLSLAEGTSRNVGREFLNNLSTSIRDAMNVNMVMLTERVSETRARAIVALAGGEAMQEFEYNLKGTPCEMVYSGERLVVETGLGSRFSAGEFASYVGVPLFADDVKRDEVVGHLSVMSREPLAAPALAESVVRIYGQRAEAELRRLAEERQRERLLDDLQRLNRRLADNYERAHRANEYKTQVLGLVAHDLRNPIGQVLGFADLIAMTLDGKDVVETAPVRDDLDQIVSVGRTMLEQVRRILDSAKEDADQLPLRAERIDLRPTIDAAVRVNADTAHRKRITLVTSDDQALPALADEGLVHEALDNLISNAIKYSGPDTNVTVSARMDGSATILAVADEGQGLDAGDIDKAFGRFQRLSAVPTAGEDSAGLGLFNVRMIAERHGGKAWVESPGKGHGATFFLSLPAE